MTESVAINFPRYHEMKEENDRLKKENKNLHNIIKVMSIDKHKSKIKFRNYVKLKTNFDIIKATSLQLDIADNIANDIIKYYAINPNYKKRINEFSNHLEKYIEYFDNESYNVRIPYIFNTRNHQVSGYPDRVILKHRTQNFYVELKIFKKNSENSTFRSFYVTLPNNTHKITASIPHILISLEHNNEKDALGNRLLTGNYKIKDLYDINTEIKSECWTSNKGMYN